ncbi:family 20 glycosylhydrolase [Chitinophaga sp. sic0106]|uniref:glycoside hydrolase family 20 protein n=1 Tax=Chitinophaga sp. sic0106 TaxID=2854785 RepID=UPI001C47F615|nr:family 20 glycosylhydrolase [Chitinophaga sp. sic0106]MBV7531961.1 family 20 glycosylhydrolase [Chitinophaga sp. sic0106]
MIRKLAIMVTAIVATYTTAFAQANLNLIPQPREISSQPGHFQWQKHTPIIASPAFKNVADLIATQNQPVKIFSGRHKADFAGTIRILEADSRTVPDSNGYQLQVTPSSIAVYARNAAGAISGAQTLMQLRLLQPDTNLIPAVTINDQPRFGHRGVMLDVSRTFYPISYIKRFLDLMWLYKMNTFHWHLTDGAGWRLQIKQFPELTQTAAWRYGNTWKDWAATGHRYAHEGDPNAYGGYYSQEQAREIVAYAAKRGITVIPEIEMPGHAEEVLAVYPQLSCSGIPYKNSEFCLGNDQTFDFLEKVLIEVMDIFPSAYIHMGGDEANKSAWKTCPKCQQRIKSAQLKDVEELQSYAIRRMERFLKSHQRHLLGWDEILEGGLAPDATVMSWRGENGGIAAAKAGHNVIMTPGAYCYFDHYQADPATQPEAQGGYVPLEKVYSYNPVPAALSATEAKHILGVQANIWTELIPHAAHLEYMAYPRIIALSEVAWSDTAHKNFAAFKARLQSHYLLLQRLNVNYFRPSYTVTIKPEINYQSKQTTVTFTSEQYQPVIRYTMDGTTPNAASTLYSGPVTFSGPALIRAAIFRDTMIQGTPALLEADFHKAIGKRVTYNLPYSKNYPAQKESTLTNGYRGSVSYGDGQWQGFEAHDMDVTIDMGTTEKLNDVSINFMQLTGVGIYIPSEVEIAVSPDGKAFQTVQLQKNDVPDNISVLTFKKFATSLNGQLARYIRVKAKNAQKGFLFADEVIVH